MPDVAFIVFYGCFFFFGTVFYSDPVLWQSIEKNRNKLLVAAVLILIPFYGVFIHWHKFITLPFDVRALELIFDIRALCGYNLFQISYLEIFPLTEFKHLLEMISFQCVKILHFEVIIQKNSLDFEFVAIPEIDQVVSLPHSQHIK